MQIRKSLPWFGLAVLTVIPAVYFAIENPVIIFAVAVVGALFGVLAAINTWWRRAYVLVLITMVAGASGLEALATVGTYTKVGAVVLLLAVTLYDSQEKPRVFANQMHQWMLFALWVLAGFAMLSVLWSESRVETLTDGGTVVALVLVLHLTTTVRWRDRHTMVRDLTAGHWTMTIILAVGTMLAFAGVSWAVLPNGRHHGLFDNPNLLGIVSVVVLGVGLGLALMKRTPLLWASVVIAAGCVVLSGSRTAVIAAAVGIGWALMRDRFVRIIPTGIITAICVLAVQVSGSTFFDDTFSRFGELQEGNILNSRTYAWQDALWNVQNNPLGSGWAATRVAMSSLYAAGYVDSGIFTMHNSWVQIFNELGWASLIPISLLVIATLRVILTANPKGLGGGLIAATVAGSLTHLTESAMFGIGSPYPYLFWFAALAAIVYTGHASQDEQSDEPESDVAPRKTKSKKKQKVLVDQ